MNVVCAYVDTICSKKPRKKLRSSAEFFTPECRTVFCAWAREGGRSPRDIKFYRECRILASYSFIPSNLSSICIQEPFLYSRAILGQFHFMSCLLSGIHFRSVAVVVCNIFRRKRIPSFAFNRNLSFKAFNAVLNKSRFLRENVGIFARPKCLWNAKEGGGGMKGDFAQRNPRTPSVTRSIFEKPTRWNFGHYAGSGCKFVPESHFVSSFMPIICILSPPMQFPFPGTAAARETPNKISGQGLDSWKSKV